MNNQTAMNAVADDIPQESADALIRSMKGIVRANTGLEICVEREMWPGRQANQSVFVVALPPDATPEQRAEADYWINEIGPIFRYADQPTNPPADQQA